ncbi:hypothetical protein HQ590_12590 [bacterium]|nr:hypothetical protein [bacterium]
MAITSINAAEAIIEPFWDARLSDLSKWTITDGTSHGLQVAQSWCWVRFEWPRRPRRGPALRMSRQFDLACDGYDHLLVSAMAPPRSKLHITVTTDKGVRRLSTPPAPPQKKEWVLNLRGARRFAATIDATTGWEGLYRRWIRRWDSPRPDQLVIEDDYDLDRGDGVEFYWHTRLRVTVAGHRVTIRDRKGVVELEAPADCEVRVDKLPLLDGTTQRRITFSRRGTAGRIRVVARLRGRS